MTENVGRINLQIEDCFKQFEVSFNRVKYFSCIASNLNESHLPAKWEIYNPNGITYNMPSPNSSDLIIKGYQHFIQRYLVRDCIESFALCLDGLCLVLMLNGKRVPSNIILIDALSLEEKNYFKHFQAVGLFSKVKKLEDDFFLSLAKDNKRVITSLKDIRNCFSHSNGIVRNIDGREFSKDERHFIWRYIRIFVKDADGGEERPLVMGMEVKKGSHICMQLTEYSKTFKIGESISFSPIETYDIAYSLQISAANYLEILKEKLGIKNVAA